MKSTAIAILLTGLLLAAARPAHAGDAVDHCTGYITTLPAVISTPGVWCLRTDHNVNMQAGAAISINASNVTLACDEHRLGNIAAGPETGATGIRARGRSNVVVRDCRVRGFRTGILLDGFSLEVERNRLDANTVHGIIVSGDASLVRDNRVLDTGDPVLGADAIGIYAIGRADILDNEVLGITCANSASYRDVRCHGIRSESGLDSLITRNRVRDIDSQKVVEGRIEHSGIEASAPGQVRIVDNHLPTESIHCSSTAARSRGNSTLGTQGCASQGDNP